MSLRSVGCGLAVACLFFNVATGDPGNNTFSELPSSEILDGWDSASPGVRQALRKALDDDAATARPALVDALERGPLSHKLLACEVLGRVADPAACEALRKALWDPEPKVQAKALTALSPGPGAADAVRAKLAEAPRGAVLKAGLAALGRLGSSEDLALLATYLDDPDEAVRVNAAAALAQLGDERGESVLLNALESPDPQARREATYALGFIDSAESVRRLEAIVLDPQGRWRTEAEIALALHDLRSLPTESDRIGYLSVLAAGDNEERADWARARLSELGAAPPVELKHARAVHGGGVGGDPDRNLTAHSFVVLGDGFTEAQRREVALGTVDEDDRAQPINHFYNPVTGQNTMPFARITALGLAARHHNRAVQLWFRGRHFGKRGAFYTLGRSIHLLQDMTSPAHVHDDPHVPFIDSDDFEFWGEVNYQIPPDVLANLEPWEPEGEIVLPGGVRVDSASPPGMIQHMALFTYRLTSYPAVLVEAPGPQPDSELNRMFPDGRLYYQDGGILGSHYWQIDDVGPYGGLGKDRWWPCAGDFQIDYLGPGGTPRIVGAVYIENIGGNHDDLVPAVFERPLAHLADPAGLTFLEIYAAELYPENVRFGAAYLKAFLDATEEPTFGCTPPPSGATRRASGDPLLLLGVVAVLLVAGRRRR